MTRYLVAKARRESGSAGSRPTWSSILGFFDFQVHDVLGRLSSEAQPRVHEGAAVLAEHGSRELQDVIEIPVADATGQLDRESMLVTPSPSRDPAPLFLC